jgi:hypothetical protein
VKRQDIILQTDEISKYKGRVDEYWAFNSTFTNEEDDKTTADSSSDVAFCVSRPCVPYGSLFFNNNTSVFFFHYRWNIVRCNENTG